MPKSPPAYDYYNPSTWLVAPEDVEEEEDTSIAAQNARAEAAAELDAAAALEASKTDDVFAKFAIKIQRAEDKEAEEEREYMEQQHRQQERHGRQAFTGTHETKSARHEECANTPPELQVRALWATVYAQCVLYAV